jgi:hypothetical protein
MITFGKINSGRPDWFLSMKLTGATSSSVPSSGTLAYSDACVFNFGPRSEPDQPAKPALTSAGPVAGLHRGAGPYQSLLLIPTSLVEPLKLIAVAVAGEGHWITRTVMIVVAYAASLLLVERLFMIVKPKLLTLPWFARLWDWLVALRGKALGCFAGRETTPRHESGPWRPPTWRSCAACGWHEPQLFKSERTVKGSFRLRCSLSLRRGLACRGAVRI